MQLDFFSTLNFKNSSKNDRSARNRSTERERRRKKKKKKAEGKNEEEKEKKKKKNKRNVVSVRACIRAYIRFDCI